MARRVVDLDEKIEKAQADVAVAKAKYDKAVDELEKLLTKRKERDNKKLLDAFTKSDKIRGRKLAIIWVESGTKSADMDGNRRKYVRNGSELWTELGSAEGLVLLFYPPKEQMFDFLLTDHLPQCYTLSCRKTMAESDRHLPYRF